MLKGILVSPTQEELTALKDYDRCTSPVNQDFCTQHFFRGVRNIVVFTP